MSENIDNKIDTRQPQADGVGAAPNGPKRGAAPKNEDQRESCNFLPAGSRKPVPAYIHERSRADVNVAELELRDGSRVQSVPRWNGQGEQPPFDVWVR